MVTERFALYTTVYPGVEKYLSPWYDSVLAQTDRNFDIWIGVDELDISKVVAAIGKDPSAKWVMSDKGVSPAQIRQKAIEQMVNEYPAVIFVDSDDLLDPKRVEAAKRSLEQCDVNGCAMRLIDEDGKDLGMVFEPPEGEDVKTLLLRNNVFGLSNTAYWSKILSQCLPIPAECVLVDWFLVTSAWTLGARLGFDFNCRMAYRQHQANIVQILPPFTTQQVILATEQVLNHYACILSNLSSLNPQYRLAIEKVRNRAEVFYRSITNSSNILEQYVSALNQLPPKHPWWACVAHPKLEGIWRN